MRIVLHTEGTRGDHVPFFALGQALQSGGHQVTLVINPAAGEAARAAGLCAVYLTDKLRDSQEARDNAWAWDQWHHPDPTLHPRAERFDPDLFTTQCRELITATRDADLLVSTAIRPLGFVAHAAVGLPWVTASVNPSTFAPRNSAALQKATRSVGVREHRNLSAAFGYAFAQLGLTQLLPPWSRGWLFARDILLGCSPLLATIDPEELAPQGHIHQTGFWFFDNPEWADWTPDPWLDAFMARRPMVLTFSSQPLEDPGAILSRHVAAAARLGLPLLVVRGWAGFDRDYLAEPVDDTMVAFVDAVPHDWAFARATCAILHGGIGSIAQAARQGCPMLVEPFGNDQFFNAARVSALGLGDTAHPFETTAEQLARVLADRVLVPAARRRVSRLAARLAEERGLDEAVGVIEAAVDRARARRVFVAQSPPVGQTSSLPVPRPGAPAILLSGVGRRPTPGDTPMIPRVLHQTWKDTALPQDLAAYRATWLRAHPDWTCHLWTDVDNRAFLARHYPWFLAIYDEYPEPIMRVDAVRYFLLYHFGGVYCDLDVECLRPIEPLLEGRRVVLGHEPASHAIESDVHAHGMSRLIGNAIMASVPGDPFWEHVIRHLVLSHREAETLSATGPFLMTRAYESYERPESIQVEPAARLYPVDHADLASGDLDAVRARVAGEAFAIHWWRGDWWRGKAAAQPSQFRTTLLLGGQALATMALRMDQSLATLYQQAPLPLVSCLMVTRDRADLALQAVESYRRQTYPQRELVVVDDGADDTLARTISALEDPSIRMVRLPGQDLPLGAARNRAVAEARGQWIAQWDDDDVSHPQRLAMQMAAIRAMRVEACCLERETMWWPAQRRLATSCRRVWEGSVLAARDRLPAYPEERRGEDTPVVAELIRRGRAVLLDAPMLYVYVFHGTNTFGAAHWDAHWRAATEQCEGIAYDVARARLQQALGVDLGPWERRVGDVGDAMRVPPQPAGRPAVPASASTIRTETRPRVLILSPVKDGTRVLPQFFHNLQTLSYPHDRLSAAFLEGDSADGTHEWLNAHAQELRDTMARVEVYKRDYGFVLSGHRADASEQLARRSVLARSRNYLLARALADEEWVLWVDADVCRWPADVIQQLLAAGKDIVVPNCLVEGTDRAFDLGTFRLAPDADQLDWTPFLVDGLLQPPAGFGRHYLTDLRNFSCVSVDAVGGTMLLVRADVHREGVVFPVAPYKHFIETEGLAVLARDMGYRCWGLPNVEIFHPADLSRVV